MNNLIVFCINRSSFVNILTFVIIFFGIYSLYTIQRENFPSVDYDIVVFTTVYKGASPKEVEKFVTNPLEKEITEVDGLEEVGSFSIENLSGITIRVDPDANYEKVLNDLKSVVDNVELPADTEKTTYMELSSNRLPIIEIAILSKENKYTVQVEQDLKKRARALEDKLALIPAIGQISLRGWRDREIKVEMDPNKLNRYEVTSQLIVNAIKTRNINSPGGLLDADILQNIRTIGEFQNIKEIENVPVRSNEVGRKIFIKDVAEVKDDLQEANELNRIQGKRGISILVTKKTNVDVIDLVTKISKLVNKYSTTFPDYDYLILRDQSKDVERSLTLIRNNFGFGFILVIVSLFLFLNWRIAFMTALGIPVAIGLTLIVMNQMGITLNLITLLGLILVIGIMVDDAIIICENIYRKIEEGLSPYDATVKGTIEILPSVVAAVSTTMMSFAPMLFISGIFGKFIKMLPIVVIIALAASLIEALFILPSHVYEASKFGKNKKKQQEKKKKKNFFDVVKNKIYLPILKKTLQFPKLTLLSFVLLLFFSLFLGAKFGKFKLFPGNVETFFVKVTTPLGYNLEKTEKLVQLIEEKVERYGKEKIESYSSRVGIQQTRFDDPFTKRGKNYAYLQVDLKREASEQTNEIIKKLREETKWLLSEEQVLAKTGKNLGQLNNIEFELENPGPPVGKPIAIKIMGSDFDILEEIAAEINTILKDIKGVKDLGNTFSKGNEELHIKVDEALASQTKLNIAAISDSISTAYLGKVATEIKLFIEEVGIRVILPKEKRENLDSLKKLQIFNDQNQLIPINQMVEYKKAPGYSTINHLNNKRVFTILGSIDEEQTTAREVNSQLAKELQASGIYNKYPEYDISLGGEFEDTQKSLTSLGFAFLFGFFGILTILSLIFNSIKQSIIILSILPFTLIGVILSFVFHGEYFGFMPFLGVVGLIGVVVNDSIILVDKANQLIKENPTKPLTEILLKTGELRLRAVLLTTITTAAGLLPTAYGLGGKDVFVGLIALGFGWGLIFASLITLFFVPALYLLLEKRKHAKRLALKV